MNEIFRDRTRRQQPKPAPQGRNNRKGNRERDLPRSANERDVTRPDHERDLPRSHKSGTTENQPRREEQPRTSPAGRNNR